MTKLLSVRWYITYHKFIESFINRQRLEGRTVRHHIVPKSLGGSDAPSNFVFLTLREHLFVHKLLHKAHGGRMSMALTLMLDTADVGRPSRLYEEAMILALKCRSESEKRSRRPDYVNPRKGVTLSPVTLQKVKEAAIRLNSSEGYVNSFSGRSHTLSTVIKIRDKALARTHAPGFVHPMEGIAKSDATKKRISEAHMDRLRAEGFVHPNKGRVHSKEALDKMSRAAKSRSMLRGSKGRFRSLN